MSQANCFRKRKKEERKGDVRSLGGLLRYLSGEAAATSTQQKLQTEAAPGEVGALQLASRRQKYLPWGDPGEPGEVGAGMFALPCWAASV